jgi:hypothetical protein
LFVVVGVAGWRGLDAGERSLDPVAAAVVLVVLAPLTTALNGAEYACTARLVGVRVGPAEGVRVAVLGSAANLLPLPGAVLVRTEALRRRGTGLAGAAKASTVAAVVWAGAAAAVAGALQVADGRAALGAAGLGGGALLVGAGMVAAARVQRSGPGTDGRARAALLATETATVAVGALRLALVAAELPGDLDVAGAAVLNVASVAAAAAGVLPGGLGLREAVAAALAPLVDAPAAAGAVAATLDRLLGLPTVALGAVVLSLRGRASAPAGPRTPAAPRP